MRHAKIAIMTVLVGLSLFVPIAVANAAPPPCVGWFPVAEVLQGLMVHSDGSIWVGGTNHVFRYSQSGVQLGVVAGFGAVAMAEAPGGDVYVLNYSGRTVNHVTSGGVLLGSWPMTGINHDGGRVAVDASGNVYVMGYTGASTNCILIKYDGAGNHLASVEGINGSDGLAISGGLIYCSEVYHGVIRIFTPDLVDAGSIPNPATYGTGLATDKAGNLLQPDYYGDVYGKTVYHLTTGGTVLGRFMTTGSGYFPTWSPTCAGESADHTYFVGDQNGYVLLFRDTSVSVTAQTWGDVKASFR